VKHDIPEVEIFAIGTELVLGRIQDTNSFWMSSQLSELGAHVNRMTILGDEISQIVEAINTALQMKNRFVIVSGGLGPTPDDLTSTALAQVFGVELAVHEPTVEDFMRRRDISDRGEVSDGMLRMATVPEGAEALPNPNGWAPCIVLTNPHTTLFAVAGPPREMEGVFTAHVAPAISKESNVSRAAARLAVTMYESEVSPHMMQVMEEFPHTYIKAYVGMRSGEEHRLPVDVVATNADADTAKITLEMAVERLTELVTLAGKEVVPLD